MGLVAAEAVPFEDFIDGYFPLGLSLRHLLNRRGFAAAWIVMLVAPMMEIPSLDPKDSVPLHIDPAHGGQIDWLSATIRCVGQSVQLSGCAIWDWYDPARSGHDAPSAATRLAEPAFIRGIGFLPGMFARTPWERSGRVPARPMCGLPGNAAKGMLSDRAAFAGN